MTKNTMRLLFVLAGALAILAVVVHVQSSPAASQKDSQQLEGSWLVNALTNIPDEPPLTALVTFTRDGDVLEVTNPSVSAGHGAWIRTGNREFAITVLYLRFDEAKTFIGTTKVRATFKLNETLDSGGGLFKTDLRDAQGNVVFSFEGTSEATRIKVESLD